MASPEPSSAVGIASIIGVITLGHTIDMATLANACLCVTIGLGGRVCFDIQRAYENGGKINLGQAIGWFGAGLLGAPFVSVMTLLLLKLAHIQSDVVTVIGLAAFGFYGSRSISWLASFAENILKKQFGNNAPPPPLPPKDGGV